MKETAGLQPAAPPNVDAASDVDRAIELWQCGLSAVKIGAELSVSVKRVRSWLREAGIDTSRPATWAGLLSLTEAEQKFTVNRHTLADAAKAGRVRTRGSSDFYGATTILFHPVELAEDLRRLTCRHEGCDGFALGASGACEAHGHIYFGGRAAGVKRPDIGPAIAASKIGKPRPDARERLLEHWRTGGAFARGTLELPWIRGDTRRVWKLRWVPRPGRPREWNEGQAAEVLRLHSIGWGTRAIAERMGDGMTRRKVRYILEHAQAS
jgi:hypothetical protein